MTIKLRKILGFTIVELTIVIVIIGIITSAVTFSIGTVRKQVRDTQRLSDMKELQTALDAYYRAEGFYPSVITFGQSLVGPASGVTYLKTIPNDPMASTPYVYYPSSDGRSYSIVYYLEKSSNGLTAGTNALTPSGTTTSCSSACNGLNCGNNICGVSCGSCSSPQTCGGGGVTNVCGCTVETDAAFCSRLSKNCDSYTAADNCGNSKTANCGSCTASLNPAQTCNSNVCGTDQYSKLLLHFNGTNGSTVFDDNSAVALGRKLGPGGGIFDGGDDLSVADSDDWAFGTGDFTIDLWVNYSTLPSAGAQALLSDWSTNGVNSAWLFYHPSGTALNFYYTTDGATVKTKSFNWGPSNVDTWYHLALVRNGGNLYLFVNGTEISHFTDLGSDSIYNTTASWPLYIGAYQQAVLGFKGRMDEVRISKGIARWTSNFTPSTTEYAADSYTKLLLHMNGESGTTTFNDSASTPKTVTRHDTAYQYKVSATGNAAISTAQKKFGSGAGSFDGSGDSLTIPNLGDWTFGSGNFTIDFWVRFNSVSSIQTVLAKRGNASTYGPFVFLYNTSGSALKLYSSSSGSSWNISNGVDILTSPTTGTWYHIAVVRNGSSIKGYANGTKTLDITSSANLIDDGYGLSVGMELDSNFPFNGYLDDLRISKGVARWTADFTPPTAEY